VPVEQTAERTLRRALQHCPRQESPTQLTFALTNQRVLADLSCDVQELELEHSVSDEAYKMDDHI
jgi:hypothetical protein